MKPSGRFWLAWAGDRHKYRCSSICPSGQRDRNEHEWPSVSCHPKVLIVWKGDVIRKYECSLAGSDNVVPTSSQALLEYKAPLIQVGARSCGYQYADSNMAE